MRSFSLSHFPDFVTLLPEKRKTFGYFIIGLTTKFLHTINFYINVLRIKNPARKNQNIQHPVDHLHSLYLCRSLVQQAKFIIHITKVKQEVSTHCSTSWEDFTVVSCLWSHYTCSLKTLVATFKY